MSSFLRTVLWVVATLLLVFAALSAAGYLFMQSHKNYLAENILSRHQDAIESLYVRIGVGYVLFGLGLAFLLHPFVRGWKAAPAALGVTLLFCLHVLTKGTQLVYGPVQSAYCAVHDAVPAWMRSLYQPVLLEVAFGGLVGWSLWRWARPVSWRVKAGAAAVAAFFAVIDLLPASTAAAADGPPCFLLIATDSLRADHLSCNGYPRATSPNIDALAARGTNFANCLVPTASTHESWVSLLSSTEPREHGLRHMFPSRALVEQVQQRCSFLPAELRKRGYHTAAIGGWCGTTFRLFDMGAEHVDVSDKQNHLAIIAEAAFINHLPAAAFLDNVVGRWIVPELESVSFTRSAPAITAKAKRWLNRAARSDEPFFLVLVYHVNHLPYSATYPYYTEFTDPDYRGDNRYRINFDIDEMIRKGFAHDLGEKDKQHIIDLYDGCVREFDAQVGALMKHLKRTGLAKRTIVGVWSDHGDDLYEHGTTLGHGVTLFGGDHANQPPAIFAGPGVPTRRVDKLVRSIDMAPTWFRWLGFEPPAAWRGVDLRGDVPDLTALLETSYLLYRQPVPDLRPGEAVKAFPRFDDATFLDPDFDHNLVMKDVHNEALIETKCFAVREGPWKLIDVPGVSGPIYRLFHLPTDPQCRRDVKDEHPEVFTRLRKQLPR